MTYNPTRFPGFDVVAYHANCTDGLAAAAVVLNRLDHTHVGKFVPIQYGQPLPEAIAKGGENIIFVDFCPELEQIPEIEKVWKDWFVIDHHQKFLYFDLSHPALSPYFRRFSFSTDRVLARRGERTQFEEIVSMLLRKKSRPP